MFKKKRKIGLKSKSQIIRQKLICASNQMKKALRETQTLRARWL